MKLCRYNDSRSGCVLGSQPHGIELSLSVNGELRQRPNTRDLIVDIPTLVALASSFHSLGPGDLLLTGGPEGVGPVAARDKIFTDFSGIGSMQVTVR